MASLNNREVVVATGRLQGRPYIHTTQLKRVYNAQSLASQSVPRTMNRRPFFRTLRRRMLSVTLYDCSFSIDCLDFGGRLYT